MMTKPTVVDRLRAAITALEAEKKPVTVRTIRDAGGPAFSSYQENAEALALFHAHSTRLNKQPEAKRRCTACGTEYDLNEKNFALYSQGRGFKHICRTCEAQQHTGPSGYNQTESAKESRKNWLNEHRPQWNEYQLKRYHEKKNK
jgi:hypothetical protein